MYRGSKKSPLFFFKAPRERFGGRGVCPLLHFSPWDLYSLFLARPSRYIQRPGGPLSFVTSASLAKRERGTTWEPQDGQQQLSPKLFFVPSRVRVGSSARAFFAREQASEYKIY